MKRSQVLRLRHADDLNALLYGINVGSIDETRYQINPDDTEVTFFCKERSAQCIKGVAGTSVALDNSSVISQLTNAISAQNEEIGFAAKKSRGLSTKKKPRKIEPKRFTIQLST